VSLAHSPHFHLHFPVLHNIRLKLTCAVLFTRAIAINPASTFILQGDEGSNLTISVNVPSDANSDDLFFHLSAPAGQTWVGFGFGTEMKDALIFIAYTSRDGSNVTISPRIGRFHEEPMYSDAVGVEVLAGTFVDNETYHINARCTDCRSWPLTSGRRGQIDAKSTAQPMIYAIGDDSPFFQTDSQEAIIRQHIAFGKFDMDLRAATGDAGVPTNSAVESGVAHGQRSGVNRLATIFHGLIMSACFVVFFPLGALLIRLPLRLAFWIHLVWQCCTVLGVIIGLSLGIYISINNNKRPQLNSPHQGLGLTVVLLVFAQASFGFFLHRTYKRTLSPSLHGQFHRYLGIIIILVGITNGALGLIFANNTGRLPAYFGLVLFVVIICMMSHWIFRRRTMRNNAIISIAASSSRERSRGVPLREYGRRDNSSEQSVAHTENEPPRYVNVMPKNEEQRMA
jgi:Cytochrome domain of cellobiose dehydrogenase/Eukaryotic cytochrome b561